MYTLSQNIYEQIISIFACTRIHIHWFRLSNISIWSIWPNWLINPTDSCSPLFLFCCFIFSILCDVQIRNNRILHTWPFQICIKHVRLRIVTGAQRLPWTFCAGRSSLFVHNSSFIVITDYWLVCVCVYEWASWCCSWFFLFWRQSLSSLNYVWVNAQFRILLIFNHFMLLLWQISKVTGLTNRRKEKLPTIVWIEMNAKTAFIHQTYDKNTKLNVW